jgi:hypothetical protein
LKLAFAFIVAVPCALLSGNAHAQPAPVAKTNPMKVYMHYMPWFETPQSLGGTLSGTNWGYHWKFNNRNPNIVDANGRRQIASHYYPKIGPYSSSDPAVIEYHTLLMKYAGVDGVLIDWYGQQGSNGDVGSLLASSNAIVGRVDDAGLKFGVILEDRFSTVSSSNQTADINKAKANLAYLRDNYFNKPEYIRINADNDPFLGVFGPIKFQTPSQWTEILAQAGEPVDFTTLWYESGDAGSNADGEYAWIYEDGAQNNHLNHQRNFWQVRAPTLGTAGGVAYPGFDDYYQEGGTGTVIGFDIPHANGQTLASTLTLASAYAANVDFLQLATFNDFGEGTMFEPTVETGFAYLRQVQQFTGVSYDEGELNLVFRLYRARKEFAGQPAIQTQLDSAAANLAALQVSAAEAILNTLSLEGDFNDDGRVDGGDYLVWQRQLGQTGLYPLATKAADGNADGIVDAADLSLWRRDLGLQVAAAGSANRAPEPSSAALLLLGLLMAEAGRRVR